MGDKYISSMTGDELEARVLAIEPIVEELKTKADKSEMRDLLIGATQWGPLTNTDPYTYYVTLAVNTIPDGKIVELYNNNPVLFAEYGFCFANVQESAITVYALEKPNTAIQLTYGVGD